MQKPRYVYVLQLFEKNVFIFQFLNDKIHNLVKDQKLVWRLYML